MSMKLIRTLITLIGCLAALSFTPRLAAQSADNLLEPKVDALFARWNKPDTPGVVCAVMQDGKVVYAKGFGMADLEHNEPLSPDSVFYIASTSKQFTAATVALLVLDGKISLDADIQVYLPEFRNLESKVTVTQLVHHTSGIRDYFSLLALTGWRDTDYFDNDMVVKLLARQRGLNFPPGTEFLYSNSNYVLLAEIVKRATGRSLRVVAEERIFGPLGMTQTHFDDDYRQIVKHRVVSYLPKPGGGYYQQLKEFDGYGDGNLLTTVRDLARWEENFYTGTVGGKAFIDLMLTKGVLTNGKDTTYAFGLFCDTYRGLPTVRHGGGFKGFRTELLRFPLQHFSVAVLSNLAVVNPSDLANKVADLYLAKDLSERKESAAPSVASIPEAKKIDPSVFDAYVGNYALDERPGFILSITRDGDRFFSQATNQAPVEIFAASESTFFLKVVNAQLTFHREADGSVNRLTLHQNGNHDAHRVTSHAVSAAELNEYVGLYYSEELDTSYRLEIEDGKLTAKHARLPAVSLVPRERDVYQVLNARVAFDRDSQGKVTGLRFTEGRVRNLVFERRDAGK